MGSQLKEYPVGVMLNGAQTVLGRILMVWLALLVGFALSLYSMEWISLSLEELLFSIVTLPVIVLYLVFVNGATFTGIFFSIIIVILASVHVLWDRFRWETFFSLCIVASVNFLYQKQALLTETSFIREFIGLFALVSLNAGIRLYGFWRYRIPKESRTTFTDQCEGRQE